MSEGLLTRASGILASQNGSFLKAALVQNRHFWALGRVRTKRLTFKGRACTESSFLGFGMGPGVGEARLVQNRHF